MEIAAKLVEKLHLRNVKFVAEAAPLLLNQGSGRTKSCQVVASSLKRQHVFVRKLIRLNFYNNFLNLFTCRPTIGMRVRSPGLDNVRFRTWTDPVTSVITTSTLVII